MIVAQTRNWFTVVVSRNLCPEWNVCVGSDATKNFHSKQELNARPILNVRLLTNEFFFGLPPPDPIKGKMVRVEINFFVCLLVSHLRLGPNFLIT